MPIYEYKCSVPTCAKRFELVQPSNAPRSAYCPWCHKRPPRVAAASSGQFKGTGFYETDYKEKK